jgi:hypothetical protein
MIFDQGDVWNPLATIFYQQLQVVLRRLGTPPYITTMEFPPEYFYWVRQEEILGGKCLIFRWSESYDLSPLDSRIEACRAIIAVIRRTGMPLY